MTAELAGSSLPPAGFPNGPRAELVQGSTAERLVLPRPCGSDHVLEDRGLS